jgi:hypothetical protein
LASSFVSYTIEVLSRLSAANIQPLTIEVGSLACHQFQLSPDGRANIKHAIESLQSHSSIADALWFGFGLRHVAHSMSITEGGFKCLAIGAALSEFYPVDIGAEIMRELANSLHAPADKTPSVLQWAEMMKSCAGVLARTDFGILLGMFQRNVRVHYPSDLDEEQSLWATPSSIAKTLQGIASVSRGETVSIEIRGNRVICWLAVLCHWYFSLKVEIRDLDDVVLFAEEEGGDVQVKFVFQPQDSAETGAPADTSSLDVVRKVYVLDNSRILTKTAMEQYISLGRAPWESIFQSTFGPDFEELIQHQQQSLGVILGSASRILLAIVSADEALPACMPCHWPLYHTSSFGRGFLEFLSDQFPELSALRKTMHSALRTTLQEAKTAYENQKNILKMHCKCPSCDQSSRTKRYESFCRVLMVETIIVLALRLSETHVVSGLHLKTGSVLSIYYNQGGIQSNPNTLLCNHTSLTTVVDWNEALGPFELCIRSFFDNSPEMALGQCLRLFSSSEANQSCGIAVAKDGICCYRNILHSGPSDDPDESRVICIMPGTIEYKSHPYSLISDDTNLDYRLESMDEVHDAPLEAITLYDKLDAYLAETTQGLKMRFQMTSTKDPSLGRIILMPGKFLGTAANAKGWVQCSNSHCRFVGERPKGDNVSMDLLGKRLRLIQGDKHVRSVALVLASLHAFFCVSRKTECLQCCLKTATGDIISRHYPRDLPLLVLDDDMERLSNEIFIISSSV